MFFPGAAPYMDKIAVGPEARTRSTSRLRRPRTSSASPRRRASTSTTSPSSSSSGTATTSSSPSCARSERGSPDHATETSLRRSRRLARGPGSTCSWGSGDPEGVISAAAIKCLGGAMQGKLWPRNDEERRQLLDAGYEVDRVLTADDLVRGDDVFVAATGVTSGALLRGVRRGESVETESIVMRSRSGTFRESSPRIHRRRSRAYERSALMTAHELHETAGASSPTTRASSRPTSRPDDQAVRLDRRRVDGEDRRFYRELLHRAGNGGRHRRRDPLRRDDPQGLGRRNAVRRSPPSKASSPGSRSTPARTTRRASRGEGDGGARTDSAEVSRSTVRSARVREMARRDHHRHGIPTVACIRANAQRWRATPRSARRQESCRSSSQRCSWTPTT